MVRDKKPLLLMFSATAIAANFETWVFDDNPIVATPQMIRPDFILAVLTANHVIYEDLRTYSDRQAAAASFHAQGTFEVRKLVQASASACAREPNKDKKPPSHLRGIEAQLAATGKGSATMIVLHRTLKRLKIKIHVQHAVSHVR